jgi:Polysaccharide lyase
MEWYSVSVAHQRSPRNPKTMKNKGVKSSLVIPCLPVILLAMACEGEDLSAEIDPGAVNSSLAAPAPAEPTTLPGSGSVESTVGCNILHRETFEGTPWAGGFGKEWYTPYAFTIASSPVYQGAKSGRFELRDTDPNVRSEVRYPGTFNGVDRWYSFSVYWPSNGMQNDSKSELFHQTHQTSKTSPPLSLIVKNGQIYAEVNGQVFSGVLGSGTSITPKIADVPKDRWVRFVIRYRFSYHADGIWQIWKDGQQVLNYAGKTIYPPAITSNLPTFKLGIYKWVWEGDHTSDARLRIMYVDDVRLGDGNCTRGDM